MAELLHLLGFLFLLGLIGGLLWRFNKREKGTVMGADARDAARYRWLRACGAEWSNLGILDGRGNLIPEALDEEIDAAMKREQP
jgi:hypothetical protein